MKKKTNVSEVYSHLFELLTLSKEHKDLLHKRGFATKEIERLGYKSIPLSRTKIIDELVSRFGNLKGIPGFFFDKTWKMSGGCGIAIPVRNRKGEIKSVKIRLDKKLGNARYIHLSSNPKSDKGKAYPDGTKAEVKVHFPLGYDNQKTIRITEGEFKADLAALETDIYTISIPGIGMWKEGINAIQELPERVEDIVICFDSDKNKRKSPYSDKPWEVAKALIDLFSVLTRLGWKPRIEDWPEDLGKGLDDVIADGNQDKVSILSFEDSEEWCLKIAEKQNQNPWFYLIETKRFINLDTLQELDKEQYNSKFVDSVKPGHQPSSIALSDAGFMKIDKMGYEPGNFKQMLREETGLTVFNHWLPSKVVREEGDVSNFVRHLDYLLGEDSSILLDYLAFILQNPGEKVKWAILIQGKQGTGKSYIGDTMNQLLGPTNVSKPSNDELHDSWTDWQACKQLVVIEEVMAAGRMALMNKLKPMITETTCHIVEKFKSSYSLPNRYNFLFFTNYPDAIILEKDDRRFCVLQSDAEPKSEEYYNELWSWTAENYGAILDFLLSRDLSNFGHNQKPPMTEGKKAVIQASIHPVERWLIDGIERKSGPFAGDIINNMDLCEVVPKALSPFKITPHKMGRFLADAGATKKKVKVEGKAFWVWILRNQKVWMEADGRTINEAYESGMASPALINPLADQRPL